MKRRFAKKLWKIGTITILGGASAACYTNYTDKSLFGDPNTVYVGGLIRFSRSLKIGLKISIDYYFSQLGLSEENPNYEVMLSRLHRRSATSLLEGCLLNGGPYIKLGQGLCTMGHILPIEYIQVLSVLQNQALTRRENELHQIFLEDIGQTPHEVFEHFDEEPIAAASLAQVFKAVTKNGERVAVKVQYQDLKPRYFSDIVTLRFLLKTIGFAHPDFNFAWVLDELADNLRNELDFIQEGLNAERCANDLKLFDFIQVPKIFWNLSTSRILVMEFIDGDKINDTDALVEKGHSLPDIDKKMFEAFAYQIFEIGFVHGDPHPGNILVRKSEEGKSMLVLLDHGLYQKISLEERMNLAYMWKAIIMEDHEMMQFYSRKLGVEDYVTFAEILTQTNCRKNNFRLRVNPTKKDLQHMTRIAKEQFEMIMVCLKAMPSTLLLIIRNLNTIRAIAHDHGNLINRFKILSRTATKAVFEQDNRNFILKKLSILYFEFRLIKLTIRRTIQDWSMAMLTYFKMIPDFKSVIKKGQYVIM